MRDEHELLSCQVCQQVLCDVFGLGDAPRVLQQLCKDDELVGASQCDSQVKDGPELMLAIWRQAEQETNDTSLHLVRITAEDELHWV